MNNKNYFGFLAQNMSLFQFFWVMFQERLNQRVVKGNWIKVEMGNEFFDAEIKLTIKRKPTFQDKVLLRDKKGLDLFELEKRLKE